MTEKTDPALSCAQEAHLLHTDPSAFFREGVGDAARHLLGTRQPPWGAMVILDDLVRRHQMRIIVELSALGLHHLAQAMIHGSPNERAAALKTDIAVLTRGTL